MLSSLKTRFDIDFHIGLVYNCGAVDNKYQGAWSRPLCAVCERVVTQPDNSMFSVCNYDCYYYWRTQITSEPSLTEVHYACFGFIKLNLVLSILLTNYNANILSNALTYQLIQCFYLNLMLSLFCFAFLFHIG
jgi:hypothetical protein